jgi:Skp family chaperone for outer membrane proteins
MKKFLTTIALLSFISMQANAAEIAVLDSDKIVKESKVMQDIQKQVAKKQKEYREELEEKQSKLEAEQKKIEGKKSILSQEAFAKEVKAFEKKVEELKSFVEEKQKSLTEGQFAAVNTVNEEVNSIVSAIAKEKNLDLVVQAAQSPFYKDSLDISDEVVTKLNQKLKTVKVKFK